MILTGECRYTLQALSHLLAPLSPEVIPPGCWEEMPALPGERSLMVAGAGMSMLSVLSVVKSAAGAGVTRTLLLGTAGQRDFLSHCGAGPVAVLSPDLPVEEIKRKVSAWTRRRRRAPPCVTAASLTSRERLVLSASLQGQHVKAVCRREGISPKTFYTHRSNALQKLGLHNVRELLLHHVGGAGSCTSAFFGVGIFADNGQGDTPFSSTCHQERAETI